MGANPFREIWVHYSFRGRTNGDWFLKIAGTGLGHPGNFRSEAFNVILFTLQDAVGHKHGEVCILYTHLGNSSVEEVYKPMRQILSPLGHYKSLLVISFQML